MDFSLFCLLLVAALLIWDLALAWINRHKPDCPEKDEQS